DGIRDLIVTGVQTCALPISRALAHLLANAWHAPQLREFLLSLPVAGMDGTLQHRMQGTAAEGHAFLKTGTLLDTRALAGYVQAEIGRASCREREATSVVALI